MAIVSVDLAFRRWADVGVVIMERVRNAAAVECEIVTLSEPDLIAPESIEPNVAGPIRLARPRPVEPDILAGRLNHLCNLRGIRMLMLDGPQAWKSRDNGHQHARTSESLLNTAAKTGLPGMVKPSTYRGFAEFCVDVYDALCRRGWKRFCTRERPQPDEERASGDRVLVESYPCAAWKALGLNALPSKRRARVSDLAEAFAALNAIVPLRVNQPPSHDQLQAVVGGLPGLALEAHDYDGARIVGLPPRREDGQWREGFIVLPVAPRRKQAGLEEMRWLH